MEHYDFDQVIDRSGTNAVKLEQMREQFGRSDLLGMWVADMDFATPPFVLEALRRRLSHPILGYSVVPDEFWPTVARWIQEHHGWKVETDWMRYVPGIVKGIGMAVNVFTSAGDKVIVQPPVYHPFRLVPEGNGRQVVWNPLRRCEDGTYEMDFDQLERVWDERCKLFILSNPHNPAGICWDADTLRRLAHFCAERNMVVVSDEIHCDMALFGCRHTPFASVSDEAARQSITFQAPSKTFNMAGLVSSYCVVPNDEVRQKFFGWLAANEFDYPPTLPIVGTLAAYREGEEWRRQMVHYIQQNVECVEAFCAQRLPALVRPLRPQASFLVWLDCRGLQLSHAALVDLFVNHARLALNDGQMFGPGGEGFMRLNVGVPRSVLQTAMQRVESAIRHVGFLK